MKLIVEFFLILTVGITPLIFTSLLYGKYREAYNRITNPEKLIGSLFSAMAPIAAVLFIVLNRPEGVASIGLLNNTNGRNGNAILVGIIAISIAILIVSLV